MTGSALPPPALDFLPGCLPDSKTDLLAVAVSGGADSFSLLDRLHQSGRKLLALTVDHGLRPESADEALRVAAWCKAHGIPHQTLHWHADTPSTGLQAAARAARYRLLIEAAQAAGTVGVVTGHTADDQAETVMQRLARGSAEGLAAMAPVTWIAAGAGAPMPLYRPLLGTRRGDLAAYAAARGLPVSTDPSNVDQRFERIRYRGLLAALAQQDLMSVEALCRTAARQRDLVVQAENAQRTLAARADFDITPWGSAIFADRSVIEGAAAPLRAGVLAAVIGAIGGRQVSASDVPSSAGFTLGGCEVSAMGKGLAIFRDVGDLRGRADGATGLTETSLPISEKSILWDCRFYLDSDALPRHGVLQPLAQALPKEVVTSTTARRKIAGVPCIVEAGAITHVPEIAFDAIAAALRGWKEGEASLLNWRTFNARNAVSPDVWRRVIRY